MKNAPNPGQAQKKKKYGKKYHWCKFHNDGNGQWVIHHPKDCRNNPANKELKANVVETPKPSEPTLTSQQGTVFAQAAAAIAALNEDGNDI